MYTYQDLTKLGENQQERITFVKSAIEQYKASSMYRTAIIANDYYRKQNTTITQYRKLLYTVSGQQVPDIYSANYKLTSGFFNRFVTQQNQYLLGNGVTFQNEDTLSKLGNNFDTKLQKLGKEALISGVAFAFFNLDHLDIFSAREFAPLYDEENGALMAGIRWWQIDTNKPLRATLYELDGYTDLMWNSDNPNGIIRTEKRFYKYNVESTDADGDTIYIGENYPSFPIVPLFANDAHQSELVGIREGIDCYDLIKSGFANNVDEASFIYWSLQGADGMDNIDLARFIKQMRTVHASVMDNEGAHAESHQIEAPYASREALLTRIEKDLYRDFMALDTESIASGAVTATQIIASYEPMNNKVDGYEYCILEFLDALFKVADITDENPTFTRSIIVNKTEEIQALIQSAQYLSEEYITEKVLTLFGDKDKVEEVSRNIASESVSRYQSGLNGETIEE